MRNEKSAQTRRKHCALAVVRQSQKNLPRRRPPSRGAGQPKFNQLEMVTTFTYKPVWWGSMHAISSYRTNRPTNTHTHTHKPTDRTDYNTSHCAAASLARNITSTSAVHRRPVVGSDLHFLCCFFWVTYLPYFYPLRSILFLSLIQICI